MTRWEPLGGAILLVVLAACTEPAPLQARFTVRGRWPGVRTIAYRIGPERGALEDGAFRNGILSALEQWEATGCVAFRPATDEEVPQLVFAWKRGRHGSCVPFGADPSVAHAGPVGPETFVHFDSGRSWADADLSLPQAALHEVGHVLGLDHSPDEDAVMYFEPSPHRARLAPTDLAGIHSLYGGGPSLSGDLLVSAGSASATLHAVAPIELCDWTVFDTDGDGASEIVVWRKDRAGNGALWSYHFTLGPALAYTTGPSWGSVAPGYEIELVGTERGERLLLLEPEHGETRALIFDDHGMLQLFEGEVPPRSQARAESPETRQGDLDGDGTLETVSRRR